MAWRIRTTVAFMLAIAVLAQRVALAGVTYYTDPAAFAAASTGLTTINSANALPVGVTNQSFVTVDGVDFGTNPGGTPNVLFNDGRYLEAPNGTMYMGFPSNISAVSFNYLPLLDGTVGVSLIGGATAEPPDSFVVSSNNPSDPLFYDDPQEFLGIISSVPISSVGIVEEGTVNVGNVAYGKQIPEPGTAVLATLALVGLTAMRCRKVNRGQSCALSS